jgi:hypothetical protein
MGHIHRRSQGNRTKTSLRGRTCAHIGGAVNNAVAVLSLRIRQRKVFAREAYYHTINLRDRTCPLMARAPGVPLVQLLDVIKRSTHQNCSQPFPTHVCLCAARTRTRDGRNASNRCPALPFVGRGCKRTAISEPEHMDANVWHLGLVSNFAFCITQSVAVSSAMFGKQWPFLRDSAVTGTFWALNNDGASLTRFACCGVAAGRHGAGRFCASFDSQLGPAFRSVLLGASIFFTKQRRCLNRETNCGHDMRKGNSTNKTKTDCFWMNTVERGCHAQRKVNLRGPCR